MLRKALVFGALWIVTCGILDARAGGKLAAAQPSSAAPAANCDKTCLDGIVDQYLAAMVAHDPSSLPLAKTVRYTENTAPIKLGDGLWQTITGLGGYKLYINDPTAGEVGLLAVVQENGVPDALALRLKVVKRQITEAEAIVVRKLDQPNLNVSGLVEPDPVLLSTVPPAERASREEMISDADKYMDGIVQGNGAIVPFAPDAERIENGNKTCPSAASSQFGAMTCEAQFNTGRLKYIAEISPRRYPVVDVEKGLVLSIVRFQHPANIHEVDIPGKGMVKMGGRYNQMPNSTEIAILFKIENHKIRFIQGTVIILPYREPLGWE